MKYYQCVAALLVFHIIPVYISVPNHTVLLVDRQLTVPAFRVDQRVCRDKASARCPQTANDRPIGASFQIVWYHWFSSAALVARNFFKAITPKSGFIFPSRLPLLFF